MSELQPPSYVEDKKKILNFERTDYSGFVQLARGKKNVEYSRTDRDKEFFTKYATHGGGCRDNVKGLENEKKILDFLQDSEVTPKVDKLKIYSEGKKARLIMEKLKGTSLDNLTPQEKGEFLNQRAQETVDSTANALHEVHQRGILLVDINEGSFILDKNHKNEITTNLVDFEFAINLNSTSLEEIQDCKSWYSRWDLALSLPENLNYKLSEVFKKSEISAWSRALSETLIGQEYIDLPIGLPKDLQRDFNIMKNRIMPVLVKKITKRAKENYKTVQEKTESENEFIINELEMELPAQIEESLLYITLGERLKFKDINLSEQTVNFMSKALSLDFKDRPTDLQEYFFLRKSEY